MPFISLGTIYGVQSMKYSACLYSSEPLIARVANFLIDVVKPERVAWLAYDNEDSHGMIDGVKGISGFRERLKAKGIDVVYEEYFPMDSTDLSSFLTKVKYVKPDILISFTSEVGQACAICKQMEELGGWENIKYFNSTETGTAKAVTKMQGSIGTYTAVLWLPGSDEPGMKSFEDVFVQHYGHAPTPELTYFYNVLWTAIKAIELAGTTDRDKVAEALRSGNLEWDSAWGPLRMSADGIGEMNGMVAQIQDGGKLVKVWPE